MFCNRCGVQLAPGATVCAACGTAQSAAAAFNPMKTVMDQVVEGAMIHGTSTRAAAEAKARELFAQLALPEPDTIGSRYPHQVWDLGQGGRCRADPPDWQALKLIEFSFHFTVTSPARCNA